MARVGYLEKAVKASYVHGRLHGEKEQGGGRLRGAFAWLSTLTLVVVLLLLSSCSSKPTPEVALLIDVSASVRASDDDLKDVALHILGALPRCAGLSIAPINERAGSLITARVPCEEAPYSDDLRAVYDRVDRELGVSLPAWRLRGNGSDYSGALRLAAQTLDAGADRLLVILGDMVDNRSLGARSMSPPNVPSINVKLPATRVYVGFLESPIVDRMSDANRAKFEENWKAMLTTAGAREVAIRPFGVHGVQAWTARMFPNPSPVYDSWRRKKGGKK